MTTNVARTRPKLQIAIPLKLLFTASILIIPCSNAMGMMMYMSFWKGEKLYWLSRHYESDSAGEYAGGLVVTFLFGLVIEALIWMRNFVYIKSQVNAIKATEALNM